MNKSVIKTEPSGNPPPTLLITKIDVVMSMRICEMAYTWKPFFRMRHIINTPMNEAMNKIISMK